MADDPATLAVLAGSAIVVVWSGLKRLPGIGVIASIIAVAGLVVLDSGVALEDLGLTRPSSWLWTIVAAVIAGFLIQLLSVVLIEPLADLLTGGEHDHSAVASVKESKLALAQIIAISWLVAAVLEEVVFRGFLLNGTRSLLGGSPTATVAAVLSTSVIFGLSHWYQGRSGAMSTAAVAILLASLFVFSGFNIWLPILTHGFIDTFGLMWIASGRVDRFQSRLTPDLLRTT